MGWDTGGSLVAASRWETGAPSHQRPADLPFLRPPTPWLADVALGGVPEVERLPADAEIVVVGGGVIGVAAAYWLAKLGAPVLVLESHRLGWGATGRNAGLVLGSPASLETMRAVLDEERIDAGYEEPGHLALASSEGVLESFHRELGARPQGAAPLHVLDHRRCEELLETRIDRRFLGGRWMPLAGGVHPARFLYGLARAAVRRGAAVASRSPVRRVRRAARGDGWQLWTARGRVRARQVVLACNALTARLWRPLGKVLAASRGQVLATRPLPPFFRFGMAVDYGALYWRQTADGRVILGGYYDLDPVAERTARVALNPRIQAALGCFLPDAFPDIPAVRVASRWAGIMDATPDGRPVVGAWPDDAGLWVAAGFSGHGLPPALGVGRSLARAIVEGAHPTELEPLAPTRFQKARAC